jgi:hypothetical protein
MNALADDGLAVLIGMVLGLIAALFVCLGTRYAVAIFAALLVINVVVRLVAVGVMTLVGGAP